MRDNQPIFFALMSDRALFTRFKERLHEREVGPVALFRAAEDYVRAEQKLGRVTTAVSPQVAATILIGACRDQVVTHALAGRKPLPPERFARELVQALVYGLGAASGPPASTIQEEPS
jgi:hypothetical protein